MTACFSTANFNVLIVKSTHTGARKVARAGRPKYQGRIIACLLDTPACCYRGHIVLIQAQQYGASLRYSFAAASTRPSKNSGQCRQHEVCCAVIIKALLTMRAFQGTAAIHFLYLAKQDQLRIGVTPTRRKYCLRCNPATIHCFRRGEEFFEIRYSIGRFVVLV